MLNKALIVFAAAVVLGSASTAFAYEDPENKIGDRYPILEKTYQSVSVNRVVSRNLMVSQISIVVPYSYEAPENKIGDRYPTLEPITKPISTSGFAGRYLTDRSGFKSVQYAYEAPENKIGDRYPLLEQQVSSQRIAARRAATSTHLTTGSIR